MKIPKGGYSLEDVCRLAHMHKVNIHVGVLVSDFLNEPPRITVQVSNNIPGTDPIAFAMDLHKMNPRLNEMLSRALLDYVQRGAPKKLIVL